jgi:hypothetical protein
MQMIFNAGMDEGTLHPWYYNHLKLFDLSDAYRYGRIEDEVLGRRLNSAIQGSKF